MNKKILAVIVLYNESLLESKTYKTLLQDSFFCEEIIIYDNSQEKQKIPILPYKYQYIHYPDNPGLSKVYNEAADYATKNQINWILLLDQDTSFPVGASAEYLKALEEYPNLKMFVPKHIIKSGNYISPVPHVWRIARMMKSLPSGIVSIKEFIPINSGILVNVDAFLEVGGYNEAVTLDFSDTQFVERFSKRYTELYILDCICTQDFSDETTDVSALLRRFKIFCRCAHFCTKDSLSDKIQYFIVVLKRTLSLSIRCKNPVFLKYFVKLYF